MSRVEEEAVAAFPSRVLGVELQVFTVEDIDEIGAAHRATRMSALSFLHHRSCQDADIVGSTGHNLFRIHSYECLVSCPQRYEKYMK